MTDTNAEQLTSQLNRVAAALDSGTLRPVRRMLNSLHAAEIAHLLESLPPHRREIVWELVDPDYDGEVLLYVADEVRASLIRNMDPHELVAASEGMDTDDLADFLQDLPDTVTQNILESMNNQDRARLETVMAYSEDSAGGLMNTDTVTVRANVTLDVVQRYLRMRGKLPALTDKLFVVDRRERYMGVLHLTDLLTHDPNETVADVYDSTQKGIAVGMESMKVAQLFQKRDFISAPVIDAENQLLGRITIDDVVDVITDEAEHSIKSLAGLGEEDDMFAPVIPSAKRRAIWLGINLLTAFLAAWVIGLFEATLDQVVALAVLMPIVASMGGIAGSQTLMLVTRGIALGQLSSANTRSLLMREISVSLLNGALWAIVVAVVSIAWFEDLMIGVIIGIALVVNLFAAALSGVAIPIMLKRMGIDPALAGGVVLTTVTDVVGFMAFLGLATVVFMH